MLPQLKGQDVKRKPSREEAHADVPLFQSLLVPVSLPRTLRTRGHPLGLQPTGDYKHQLDFGNRAARNKGMSFT